MRVEDGLQAVAAIWTGWLQGIERLELEAEDVVMMLKLAESVLEAQQELLRFLGGGRGVGGREPIDDADDSLGRG